MNADWSSPEPDEVDLAVAALVEENLKRTFFAELENPNWLAPLAAHGVFAADPEVWVDDTGLTRAQSWPEGEYLARVAAAEPLAVTDLVLKHADSSNPWVHRVVLEVAARVPVAQAARLTPQIVKALRLRPDWIDPHKLVALTEAVAAEYPKLARKLLMAAFKPAAGEEEMTVFGRRPSVVSPVESYWVRELAPRIVALLAGLGMDGLKAAVSWLTQAMDIPSGTAAQTYHGDSLWRPSIAPHPQNAGLEDLGDAIIDIVRDTAALLAHRGQLRNIVDFLEGRNRELLSRIAVETTAQIVNADSAPEVLEVAVRLLNSERLLDTHARPEYVHLALATLPRLSPAQVAGWQMLIDTQAWQGSDEDMRRIAAYRQTEPSEVSEEDIEAVRRHLKYRLLLPLEKVLPTALKSELAQMKTDLGEIEHPEFSSYITSFTGPTSPLTLADLTAMTPAELRTFLATWQPEDSNHFGPTIDGLARQLETLAENTPDLIEALADDLITLGRSYVRAAIEGWAKALATGYRPTTAVWTLLKTVATLPDDGEEPPADFSTDDPVWRWAQRSAAYFVDAYLRALGSELTMGQAIDAWAVLLPLCSHLDPTPEHEAQYGGNNMDPMMLSLNTVRPAAIRAATKLLRAAGERKDAEGTELSKAVLEMLSRHVAAAGDPSLAVAAVLGEALGHISDLNPEWIETHSDDLFALLNADDEIRTRSDVIVSVALRNYHTGTVFVELMRPVMLTMFTNKYVALDHTNGWRGGQLALEAAASHVVTAFVRDIIAEDDPLLVMLTSPELPADVIGHALGSLGWLIMRTQEADGQVDAVLQGTLDRAQQLINTRVAKIRAGQASSRELSGFYWWVRANVYPPSWTLPILQLASTDPQFEPKGMIGEALAQAAITEPALAVDAFDSLLPSGEASWSRGYDLLRYAPQILAAALRSNDSATQQRAEQIQDRLGREGHMSILAEVDRLIAD